MRVESVLFSIVLAAPAASAQRPVAAPIGAVRPARSQAQPAPGAAVRAAMSHRSRAAHAGIGALIGGTVGGVIGAVLAAERVHRPSVTDHSEDELVYIVFVGGGIVAGLVTGTVVGLVWPK